MKAYQEEFERQYGILSQEVKQAHRNINEMGLLTNDEDAASSSSSGDDSSRIMEIGEDSSS